VLDIESELLQEAEKFVSLAEVAEAGRNISRGSPSYAAVADWLLIRLKRLDNANELPRLVTMNHFYELVPVSNWDPDIEILAGLLLALREHNCLPFNHPPDGDSGGYWINNDLFSIGFEREALANAFPDVSSHLLGEVIVKDSRGQDDVMANPNELSVIPIQAEDNFRGRETLLEIIAGQATYIGKVSGKHIRATGINKLALAKDVYKALCDFGEGMSVDAEQCRKIIGEALRLKTSLNMDYMNLEGERQFAQDHE